MSDCSVKVAVRVRPFNEREIDLGAKLIIQMDGGTTTIINPENDQPKQFSFDYSYWSHDGFEVDSNGYSKGTSDKYASQQTVFDDIGMSILQNAWEGYNCSLFAYGQTGAGKSYSMVGYGTNRGIIPIICEEMFKKIAVNQEDGTSYQVTCSMLEIYNEAVRDLLNPKINPPGGLKIRSKPGVGVYVENLTPVPVMSYEEIEARMAEGTQNRTIASTKMNKTSSRAHTVFTIMFSKITKEGEATNEITSKINLVDLAGSERADSTGATGDRLKEGCAINQSLSALGNVISALADKATGKKKKVFIPYRNSVLTRLLQDALGGNSKTAMIAALSPADVNYEETLSTLRYADRAKKIKNDVSKNENPTDKIIRELKEENERLLALLSGKGIDTSSMSSGDDAAQKLKEQLDAQLEENKKLMVQLQKSWEQKREEAQALRDDEDDSGAMNAQMAKSVNLPYIINLHEDDQLTECVVYPFKEGVTTIGSGRGAKAKQDVVLTGLNIQGEHCIVANDDGHVTITPVKAAKTFVNGEIIKGQKELHTHDRVIIGNNFVFRFENPVVEEEETEEEVDEEKSSRAEKQHHRFDWSMAMEEMNKKQESRLKEAMQASIGNIEEEESAKRLELEEKLREMEAEIANAKRLAEERLAEQKMMYEEKMASGTLTESEKATLRARENEQKKQIANLSDELEKKREVSEKFMHEQLKRKRQVKKIQEQLGQLMPAINEANNMATEMNKPVKFEVRLSVKEQAASPLNEDNEVKQVDISVKVTSQEDGSLWNWSTSKFENRIFMMRDMYSQFLEFGPREVDYSEDPFWDPPESIEIGKAYVYLKALSQLVEIENSFTIVDYRGDEQGQLSVAIFPEGPNGEDVDYLDNSEQLVGQDISFRVSVDKAEKIPAKYANDSYVTFNFLGEQYVETSGCEGKTTNPQWKFEQCFKLGRVDERIRQKLLNEAMVFEVRGYTDAQISKAKALSAPPIAHAGLPTSLCDQCEERESHWECMDCSKYFCNGCYDLLHKAAKKQNHVRQPMGVSPLASPVPPAMERKISPTPSQYDRVASSSSNNAACSQCDEKGAVMHCQDCDRIFCEDCNQLLHKSKKKQDHVRVPLQQQEMQQSSDEYNNNLQELQQQQQQQQSFPQEESAIVMCQQCEEQTAQLSCLDCQDKKFCPNCFTLLHKSKKKKDHQVQELLSAA